MGIVSAGKEKSRPKVHEPGLYASLPGPEGLSNSIR